MWCSYPKIRNKQIACPLVLIVLSVLLIFLFGFADINQEGVPYSCEARVITVEAPPPDSNIINVLIVEETSVAEASKQGIYALITKDTTVGVEKIISLEGMVVLIKGIKILVQEDDQEIIVVEANSIDRLD